PPAFRYGVPRDQDLEFFGDGEAARAFARAVVSLEALGGQRVVIDLTPFFEAASLLYDGPWIAERLSEIETFVRDHPGSLLDVTRTILSRGGDVSGTGAFLGIHRLEALRQVATATWSSIDVLAVPTSPTHPTIASILESPIERNARLGRYTNFVNLL